MAQPLRIHIVLVDTNKQAQDKPIRAFICLVLQIRSGFWGLI